MPVFKTGAINHSANSPHLIVLLQGADFLSLQDIGSVVVRCTPDASQAQHDALYKKNWHSEARDFRARNLLFRCRQKTDSAPVNPASE
jgi:hypothetical protein